MAYSKEVNDHFDNPRNVGSLSKEDENVGTGLVGAPACGDVMRLQIRINDDGVIEDAKFKTFGCGSAIASSSLVTEWIKGRTISEAEEIKNIVKAKPILILDDIFSELDEIMRDKVLNEITGFDQILLSTADLALIDRNKINKAKFFSIKNGSIKQG